MEETEWLLFEPARFHRMVIAVISFSETDTNLMKSWTDINVQLVEVTGSLWLFILNADH